MSILCCNESSGQVGRRLSQDAAAGERDRQLRRSTAHPRHRRMHRRAWCVALAAAVVVEGHSPIPWRFGLAVLLVALSELHPAAHLASRRAPVDRLGRSGRSGQLRPGAGAVVGDRKLRRSGAGAHHRSQAADQGCLQRRRLHRCHRGGRAARPVVGQPASARPPGHLPLLFVAGLAFSLFTAIAVATVVAASTGGNRRQAMSSFNGISLLTTLSNVVFASASSGSPGGARAA